MEFTLNRDQADIQKAAAEFARGEFNPDAALEDDREQRYPLSLRKKACDLGFIGMHIPEEYGGQGLGVLDNALVVEAFCREDPGLGMAMGLADFGAEIILRNGNESQKKGLLPAMAQGNGMLSLGFLEEGQFTSDMETQASKNGTEYRLQGKKDFIPFAGLADNLIVACRTGPKDAGKLSLFLLDKSSERMDIRPSGTQLGMRMISMEELVLANVTAPADRLIGEENEGYGPLMGFLQEMAVEAGAMGVGMAQGAFDRALDYSGKREQFGRKIIHFDAIRNRLAEMRMQVETARLAVYRAAWLLDQGKADAVTLWTAKILGAGAALRVSSDAVQIHGGLGYMKEMHVERFYRDARALDLFLLPGKALKRRIADHIAGREGQES